MLDLARKQLWEHAIKLCRYVKESSLWSTLAALSLQMQELNTCEVAYAAIDDVTVINFEKKV